MDLSIRAKNIKLLEENMEKKHSYLGLEKVFLRAKSTLYVMD